MDKKYLPDLISELDQELLRLGYTKGSMTFYRRRWNQLMAYAEDRGEYYYTEQLGIDFVQEFFSITQDDFARILPQAETQELRVIRMVGDFQLGNIYKNFRRFLWKAGISHSGDGPRVHDFRHENVLESILYPVSQPLRSP